MIKEDLQNRIDTLFPGLNNKAEITNENTVAADNLWKTVSDKYVDKVRKILAPIDGLTLDVYPDLAVRNPQASPTVQVEVIDSMGDAIENNADWDKSDIQNHYVDVKLDRISRPFYLTSYDLMHGERIESKVGAAMETVAQAVVKKFFTAATAGAAKETIATFGPEAAATLSAAFGDKRETEALILEPAAYSKLVPTNGLSLNPEVEGTYGIGRIHKSLIGVEGVNAIALAKDAVVGAMGTQENVLSQPGQIVQSLGTVAGIPMVLIGHWSYDKQAMKMSVETFAGFTQTSADFVKTYAIQG